MNPLISAAVSNGRLGGSELLFWLVIILIVLAIIYFIKAIF